MTTSHQIRVRLTSRVSASESDSESVNVRLSNEERAYVQDLAVKNGYSARRGISTFIRNVGIAAAADYQTTPPTRSPGEVLYLASDACGLALGAWLRLILLGQIERHAYCARAALESGDLKLDREGEEDE